jgi:flagellar biosynthesis protein FlhG
MNRVSERFWKAADQLLLVTTPDSTALMNAYSALKTFTLRHGELRVRSIINRATDPREALESHSRLALACRRFLGWEPDCAGFFADSQEVAASVRRRWPFVLSSPHCAAAEATEQLTEKLCRFNITRERLEFKQTIQAIQT